MRVANEGRTKKNAIDALVRTSVAQRPSESSYLSLSTSARCVSFFFLFSVFFCVHFVRTRSRFWRQISCLFDAGFSFLLLFFFNGRDVVFAVSDRSCAVDRPCRSFSILIFCFAMGRLESSSGWLHFDGQRRKRLTF